MPRRIFINVIGFTDVERHALNTLFRLAEERDSKYSLWLPGAPEAASLALIDGQSTQAQTWLEHIPPDHQGHLFWVGPVAPAHAARVFERPIHWPQVVKSMDELFEAGPQLDFDIESGSAPLEPEVKRALVMDVDRDSRLYFRAKLASAGIHAVDEATSGYQALSMLRAQHYELAVIDMSLPDVDLDIWALMDDISEIRPSIPHVLLTCAKRSMALSVKGWLNGVEAVLSKPPHPGKLQSLLQKI